MIRRKPKEKLLQIDSGYYCAGIVIYKDAVIKAAPIIKWMQGKTEAFVRNYCKRKKFILNEI